MQISGTAAKLARNKSYHHFTLLLNTDKLQLKTVLHTDMVRLSLFSKEALFSLFCITILNKKQVIEYQEITGCFLKLQLFPVWQLQIQSSMATFVGLKAIPSAFVLKQRSCHLLHKYGFRLVLTHRNSVRMTGCSYACIVEILLKWC